MLENLPKHIIVHSIVILWPYGIDEFRSNCRFSFSDFLLSIFFLFILSFTGDCDERTEKYHQLVSVMC